MRITPSQLLFAVLLGIACLLTCWISNVQFYGLIDAETAVLGSMWAVIATIFASRKSHIKSLSARLVRILATVSSTILCSLYLLLFPFSPIGLAALVAISYLIANAVGHLDDTMTAGITITV